MINKITTPYFPKTFQIPTSATRDLITSASVVEIAISQPSFIEKTLANPFDTFATSSVSSILDSAIAHHTNMNSVLKELAPSHLIGDTIGGFYNSFNLSNSSFSAVLESTLKRQEIIYNMVRRGICASMQSTGFSNIDSFHNSSLVQSLISSMPNISTAEPLINISEVSLWENLDYLDFEVTVPVEMTSYGARKRISAFLRENNFEIMPFIADLLDPDMPKPKVLNKHKYAILCLIAVSVIPYCYGKYSSHIEKAELEQNLKQIQSTNDSQTKRIQNIETTLQKQLSNH